MTRVAVFISHEDALENLRTQRRSLIDSYAVGDVPSDLSAIDYWLYINDVEILLELAALDRAIRLYECFVAVREDFKKRRRGMLYPVLDLQCLGNPQDGFTAINFSRDNSGLIRCPFCASDDLNVDNGGNYKVHCYTCGANGPMGHPSDVHEGLITSVDTCRRLHEQAFVSAVDGWQRRAEVVGQ